MLTLLEKENYIKRKLYVCLETNIVNLSYYWSNSTIQL